MWSIPAVSDPNHTDSARIGFSSTPPPGSLIGRLDGVVSLALVVVITLPGGVLQEPEPGFLDVVLGILDRPRMALRLLHDVLPEDAVLFLKPDPVLACQCSPPMAPPDVQGGEGFSSLGCYDR